MNGYQIVRNFNISYLTDSEMDGIAKDIYNYIDGCLNNLNIYTCDSKGYINYRYLGTKVDDLYIGYSLTRKEVWIYRKFYEELNEKFELVESDLEHIMKWFLMKLDWAVDVCKIDRVSITNPSLTDEFYIIDTVDL